MYPDCLDELSLVRAELAAAFNAHRKPLAKSYGVPDKRGNRVRSFARGQDDAI